MPDVPTSPEQLRFREPRQERIHQRLVLIGQRAAAFYGTSAVSWPGAAPQLETAAETIVTKTRDVADACQAAGTFVSVLIAAQEPEKVRGDTDPDDR